MSAPANSPLVRTVRVACSIEHAFDTFTEGIDLWWPHSHRRFEGSRMSLETIAGGRFREIGSTGEEASLGEVVRCERPELISYTWYPGAIAGPTLVEVYFTDNGDHTLVEVIHSEGESGLGEEWPQRAQRFERAWEEVLPAFAAQAGFRDENSGMRTQG